MAYYQGSNPDALPAHAEPDEVYPHRPHQQHPPPQHPPSQHSPSPSQHPPSQHRPNPHYGSNSPHPDPYRQGSFSQPPPPRPNPYASPPPGAYGQRPPPMSRPPPTPAPPIQGQGIDPALFALFKAVDKDGSGQLSERELRAALVNGDWSSFDPHTVRMMIRMFDTDRSGTIGFNEFCGLWGFLASWRTLFDRFDVDGSGNISYAEYSNALAAFGYRLSPQFVQLLFRSYDRRGTESTPQPAAVQQGGDGLLSSPPQANNEKLGQDAISFDLFVQSCISLKRMTEVFKKYDDDRDGFITLSFEEFLT
ncbi:hypothetical protein RUND412_008053, partial [Rhizina undulata]